MPPSGSTLEEVAARVEGRVIGDTSTRLTDVTHDSREAGPGTLFVAVRGERHDGHDHVEEAIAAGSPAVAVDHPMQVEAAQLVVADTRASMGAMAAQVHGDPSQHLAVIGVTGTNGKTTVTHYLESMLSSAGRVAGLVGTIGTRVGTTEIPTQRTTPEATDFQRILATMLEQGADSVAAEVSSHALELGRVAATRFEVAAFTNLSQDHLDFHKDMASYRRAKERLFAEYPIGTAVVNVDDPAGAEIAGKMTVPVIRVGAGGEVGAAGIQTSFEGTSFELQVPGGRAVVRSPIIGAFNVQNALVAVGCCLALGVSLDQIVEGLGALGPVPGRFEPVATGLPVHVVVDYAHTPEGIGQAIAVAKSIGRGRVIALVGAGGDRDREKRPLMGRAVSAADVAILTSDNPRSEDPARILDELSAGAREDALVEVDRRRAIETAIGSAVDGDVVLILGKGHETGQQIGDRLTPFDDREVAREVLRSRFGSANLAAGSGSMSA